MTIVPLFAVNQEKLYKQAEKKKYKRELKKLQAKQEYTKNFAKGVQKNSTSPILTRKENVAMIREMVNNYFYNKISKNNILHLAKIPQNSKLFLQFIREKFHNSPNITKTQYDRIVSLLQDLGDISRIRTYDNIKERAKNKKPIILQKKRTIKGFLKPMNNNPKWYR